MVDTASSTELVDNLPGLFKGPGLPNDIAKAALFFASELRCLCKRSDIGWRMDVCLPDRHARRIRLVGEGELGAGELAVILTGLRTA